MKTEAWQTAKARARAAGYTVEEGAYTGTSDDVAGTYYISRPGQTYVCRQGRGFERISEAWREAAADLDDRAQHGY